MMRRTWIASLALVLGAAACGTSTAKSGHGPSVAVRDPLKLVAATADATAHAKTAKVAVTATMKGAALPRTISLDMNGEIALDGSAAEYTMDLGSILPNAPSGAVVDARMVDGVLYMDFGALMHALGSQLGNIPGLPNLKWVKLDLSGLTGNSSSGSSNSPASFTQYLDYLRGVAKNGVQTVGHEQVRGVDTTHFRAEIDWSKAVAALEHRLPTMSPDTRALMQKSIDALKQVKTSMVANVWIDNNGLTRRLDMNIPLPIPGAGNASMDMSMELYDFGVPVNVQAPPPSEVTDLSQLAGSAGASI